MTFWYGVINMDNNAAYLPSISGERTAEAEVKPW